MPDFLSLINGTDVRGTAIAVEGDPVTLTDEAVVSLSKAFCAWLLAEKSLRPRAIAVGHDSRLSSKRIEQCLVEGITACGIDVILTGLSSTPSMFMLLQEDFGADASVMITASHLPFQKNGLKFFVKEGGLESADVKKIATLAAEGASVPSRVHGKALSKSYIEKYAAGLVEKVRASTGKEKPLAGKKILVDAGNGAGGFYVDLVLKPLGADTAGSQFLEPDGRFPNHIPNPENEGAMQSVCGAVKQCGADFGIIFDTDVDRAGAVGKGGEEINRNRLIALISAILLEERAGATIVTDSVTSDGLTQFISAHGGVHHRFKRGYKNVINESKRLNETGVYSPLAIETSGHAALKENYFLDDGAYLVTRLLIALAKKGDLESLIEDLPEPKEAKEVRLSFEKGCDFKALGASLLEGLKEEVAHGTPVSPKKSYLSLTEPNFEGVRIRFASGKGDGWALVRMSLHEPILPINMESNAAGGVKIIADELYALLKRYPFVDSEKLKTI